MSEQAKIESRRSSQQIKNRLDAIISERAEKLAVIFEKMMTTRVVETHS